MKPKREVTGLELSRRLNEAFTPPMHPAWIWERHGGMAKRLWWKLVPVTDYCSPDQNDVVAWTLGDILAKAMRPPRHHDVCLYPDMVWFDSTRWSCRGNYAQAVGEAVLAAKTDHQWPRRRRERSRVSGGKGEGRMKRQYRLTDGQLRYVLDACKAVPYLVVNANDAWRTIAAQLNVEWNSIEDARTGDEHDILAFPKPQQEAKK